MKKYRLEWTEVLTTRLMIYWDECDGDYKQVAIKMRLPPIKVRDKAKTIGLRKHKSKLVRRCLTRTREFFSDGSHNRICGICTKSDLIRGNVA